MLSVQAGRLKTITRYRFVLGCKANLGDAAYVRVFARLSIIFEAHPSIPIFTQYHTH